MNVENLIALARQKVSGRVPNYIDLGMASKLAHPEIANMAVERVQTALEQAILGAQSILKSTCAKYIEGLYIRDDLTIGIRQEVAYLESGYDQREMLDDMLDSPKAKMSKDGNKYLIVPMGDKPSPNIAQAVGKKTSELFLKGRQAKASGRTLDSLVRDMQSITQRAPKVASNPPKNATSSEFRTATSKQDSGSDWVHPGFSGLNQLEFINQQLRVDLEEGAVRLLENAIEGMRR